MFGVLDNLSGSLVSLFQGGSWYPHPHASGSRFQVGPETDLELDQQHQHHFWVLTVSRCGVVASGSWKLCLGKNTPLFLPFIVSVGDNKTWSMLWNFFLVRNSLKVDFPTGGGPGMLCIWKFWWWVDKTECLDGKGTDKRDVQAIL